jgi:mono/diheme cytochrome c family protein
MRAYSAFSLIVLSLAAGPSFAAPTTQKPDPKHGQTLAERVCVACHVITKSPSTATVDVPSFPTIANEPGQSMETIAGRIVIPHPPMISIPLTRAEIADLAAYIMTFKEPGGSNP